MEADGSVIHADQTDVSITSTDEAAVHTYEMVNPRLWNGKQDPYMYQVKVELLQDGNVIDEIWQPLGLRYFHADANEGFFLNGKPVDLRGVSRHQDRQDKGSAISDADHREDMDIMLEMGINALTTGTLSTCGAGV